MYKSLIKIWLAELKDYRISNNGKGINYKYFVNNVEDDLVYEIPLMLV